jgi:hypothetical protein
MKLQALRNPSFSTTTASFDKSLFFFAPKLTLYSAFLRNLQNTKQLKQRALTLNASKTEKEFLFFFLPIARARSWALFVDVLNL